MTKQPELFNSATKYNHSESYSNDAKARINALYNRRNTTPWSDKETTILRRLLKDYCVTGMAVFLADLNSVSEYYQYLYEESLKPPFSDFRRRQIDTFLRNFQGEVDKAKQWSIRRDAMDSFSKNSGPNGWRSAIAEIYKGSGIKIPSSWSIVDEGTRAEVIRRMKC
jgi:hypothetical protein